MLGWRKVENDFKKIQKIQNFNALSWTSPEVKFLFRGYEVALTSEELPLTDSVAMLTSMSIFHPCLKLSTGEVLVVV